MVVLPRPPKPHFLQSPLPWVCPRLQAELPGNRCSLPALLVKTLETALSKLEDAGLIERRRSGFSKPNRIYVKLPPDGQKTFQVADRNPSSIGTENCPTDGKKIVPMMERKLSPNNLISSNLNQNHISRESKAPTAYGRYKNVFLLDTEYAELLRDWCFAQDNGANPQMKHARFYADNFDTMLSENVGYLLWGSVGTGKSFFAACIANALMEKEIPVRMTNFAAVLNDLSGSFEGRNQYIARLCRYPLLILDDFGMERGTEYALEQVYNVIDSRSFLCRKDDPQGGQHHLPRDAAFQRKRQGGYAHALCP